MSLNYDIIEKKVVERHNTLKMNRQQIRAKSHVTAIIITVILLIAFHIQGAPQGIPVVNANLIGLDFGSSFMKATLVRPGKKFAIVENTASKRKTESMVTLGKENRLYGADSLMDSGKYPLTTFSELFRFFG